VGRVGIHATARAAAPAYDQGERDFAFGAAAAPAAAPPLPPRVAALPKGARPLIAPDARAASRIPRSTRQAVLDRLLELELEAGSEAAAAAAAALAAEASVFARSSSALLYRNLAAQRFAAAAAAAPGAAEGAADAAAAAEALLERCRVLRAPSSLAFFSQALSHRAHAVELLWEKPYFLMRGGASAEADAQAAAEPTAVRAETEPADERAAAEPAAAAEAPSAAAAAGTPSAAAAAEAPVLPPGSGSLPVAACVAAAVRACALGFLAAFGLPPAALPALAERVCAKVCSRHAGATDAAFLAREVGRVQALCAAYVQREEARKSARI